MSMYILSMTREWWQDANKKRMKWFGPSLSRAIVGVEVIVGCMDVDIRTSQEFFSFRTKTMSHGSIAKTCHGRTAVDYAHYVWKKTPNQAIVSICIASYRERPWDIDAGGFRQWLDLEQNDTYEKGAAWVDSKGCLYCDFFSMGGSVQISRWNLLVETTGVFWYDDEGMAPNFCCCWCWYRCR